MKIVYISQDVERAQPFFVYLQGRAKLLACAPLQEKIFRLLQTEKIDAVISSEKYLGMIKSIIWQFPTINYALISSCSAEDFHEATEGFGFFMQLPPAPTKDDADKLMEILAVISAVPNLPTTSEQTS